MTIFLDVSNASINPTSLLWCSLFMISISRTMSSRDEPLPAVLSRMCLAANVVFEERSVTLFTTPNFPLFDEKLDFRCHGTKKITCSWLCYILSNHKCVRKRFSGCGWIIKILGEANHSIARYSTRRLFFLKGVPLRLLNEETVRLKFLTEVNKRHNVYRPRSILTSDYMLVYGHRCLLSDLLMDIIDIVQTGLL